MVPVFVATPSWPNFRAGAPRSQVEFSLAISMVAVVAKLQLLPLRPVQLLQLLIEIGRPLNLATSTWRVQSRTNRLESDDITRATLNLERPLEGVLPLRFEAGQLRIRAAAVGGAQNLSSPLAGASRVSSPLVHLGGCALERAALLDCLRLRM